MLLHVCPLATVADQTEGIFRRMALKEGATLSSFAALQCKNCAGIVVGLLAAVELASMITLFNTVLQLLRIHQLNLGKWNVVLSDFKDKTNLPI